MTAFAARLEKNGSKKTFKHRRRVIYNITTRITKLCQSHAHYIDDLINTWQMQIRINCTNSKQASHT